MFSRNIYKRSSENQWYLNKTYKAPLLLRPPEKYDGPAQDAPHLQMSYLPAEDPRAERKRPYRDPLPQM